MDIDSLTSLALALQSRPGVYALLLGSGVSRAAEIPTGWEITLDLVDRLRRADDAESDLAPEAWYKHKFGGTPKYTTVIEHFASTRQERMLLLRPYFEPTEEERAQGKKTPTAAHKAIARLAQRGVFRVIVTTNFDRLTEQALEAEGVAPKVVASDDDVEGMMPIQHAGVLVVKLHGDYLDTRIRNTPDELAAYGDPMLGLLERILVDYGLVTCGWSAEWDDALAEAITRCGHFKFSTYWMARGDLAQRARDLVSKRLGTVVQIESADEVFGRLEDRIEALAQGRVSHPLSPELAVRETKRYLASSQHRIKLHDLIEAEVERVATSTGRDAMPWDTQPDPNEFKKRVEQIEAIAGSLTAIATTVAYHGDVQHGELLGQVVERLCREETGAGGSYQAWERLRYYPATLVVYGIGIGCIARRDLSVLKLVIAGVGERLRAREQSDVFYRVGSGLALNYDLAQYLFLTKEEQTKRKYNCPGSVWMAKRLKVMLRPIFVDMSRVDEYFDDFEYDFALISVRPGGSWVNFGRFSWKRIGPAGDVLQRQTLEEIERLGGKHPLLAAGFFEGSPAKLRDAVIEVDKFCATL